ncbi:uncharacterized protein LAESUDRAFT_241394 [Laetiporus sulphureus 93-53]|uniref:Uncharacterized protein n=1 Tax=Laetiporus sulphureus 93-53 TaxID=1314785 RepID=A0A165DKH1_9APHY|nr:uncharacterized protein LAESUDRAFT_241394 [Laetiporus sulphureus 93-53]KZT05080.1 hypothetical protein LAESUDRAFT_241394 [Laetiporus sulphureus 93-53]
MLIRALEARNNASISLYQRRIVGFVPRRSPQSASITFVSLGFYGRGVHCDFYVVLCRAILNFGAWVVLGGRRGVWGSSESMRRPTHLSFELQVCIRDRDAHLMLNPPLSDFASWVSSKVGITSADYAGASVGPNPAHGPERLCIPSMPNPLPSAFACRAPSRVRIASVDYADPSVGSSPARKPEICCYVYLEGTVFVGRCLFLISCGFCDSLLILRIELARSRVPSSRFQFPALVGLTRHANLR